MKDMAVATSSLSGTACEYVSLKWYSVHAPAMVPAERESYNAEGNNC